ncbi:MAG TPA: class I tRNA ligase family protein [Candidatus Paceibacterota bacterium]
MADINEKEILKFWQDNEIFEKSLAKPSPKGEFVFYDGPPYATGLPHYGHLLPGTIKDIIPRYKTMLGYHVERRWGWDCHGLPIENLVEKELGLNTKKEIEEYGIGKFNQKARESVLRYADQWKKMMPRVGRWVDMENDYKTMDPYFMESEMSAFKKLYEKGLVTEGFKSMHLCPRCETTLANFEVNLGYKDITDISVYVKFELVDEPGTYVLVWTTTPWTLPGNAALALGKDIKYVKVKFDGATYIVAESLAASVFEGKEFEVLEHVKVTELEGKSYKPLFDYYAKDEKLENRENGWKIYSADFVTTEEGTGVVHIAPAFGEDDMRLGEEKNLPFIQHVTRAGVFKPEVTDFAGLFVKPKSDDKDGHQVTDIEIIKKLAHEGKLFAKKKITHSYPHCWRCDTPLLNYASSSWFVKVTEIKDKLLQNNAKTNWVPSHVGEGRFGKWLEGARDWAVSRSRYWGTPIPVWRCDKCNKAEVLGTVEELKSKIPKSGNEYFVVRHGNAQNNGSSSAGVNLAGRISTKVDNPDHLSKEGIKQIEEAAQELKNTKIDLIIASPFLRTRETAEIFSEALGFAKESIVYDDRLVEVDCGEYEGKTWAEHHAYFKNTRELFEKPIPGGESFKDVKRRSAEFIYDINSKYKDKTILIIGHGFPLFALEHAAHATTNEEFIKILSTRNELQNGQVRKIEFIPVPHDANYELDLHRPFIDEVKYPCSCKGEFARVPDVLDVWFDAGSMPYASVHHLPSEKSVPPERFPADFIAESVDQTRGWFYTLSVLGTALYDKFPFENVVVSGLILAEDGLKMSKRLKNYPELDYILDKYGADAVRYYIMSSAAVHADELSFSEKGVDEVNKKLLMRLRNVVSFYSLYADQATMLPSWRPGRQHAENVLDDWILARLSQLGGEVTDALEKYEIDRAIRPFMDFVDDLSTWYLRRSRERIKESGEAVGTLRYVLLELSKLMAPFTPFIAEEIYQQVTGSRGEVADKSVHLEEWPSFQGLTKEHTDILENMRTTREVVSQALELREKAGIKVRQPLSRLQVTGERLELEYLDLIRDEVNVKGVVVGEKLELDTNITPELKREGEYRDLIRAVQDLRKEKGLKPEEVVSITLPESYKEILSGFEDEFKKAVSAQEVKFAGDKIEIK